MNIKDRFLSAVTSAVGGINDMVCMYACLSTEWNPQPYQTIPDMVVNPEPEKKEEMKNVDYYKKKFAELFMEMEKEHGCCKMLHIEHGDDVKWEDGSIMSARVEVKIEF